MEQSENYNELLIKWLNNELSESERANFEQSDDFEKYRSIVNEVDQWQVPSLNMEQSFENLQSKKNKSKVISWYQQPVLRWAAVVAVIASACLYFFLGSGEITYQTGIAETQEVILPDNSKVILGPSSSISYRKKRYLDNRRLKQKGTAYYDVQKGNSFQVDFANGSLEVLGTTFEIKSNPKFSSVECYTGHVRVSTKSGQFDLTRKKGVTISDIAEEYDFEYDWSMELTRFQSTPLREVFRSIENKFSVTIKSGSIDLDRKFTGSYSHENLNIALNMVCKPMNIKYEINGQIVTLQ